MKKNMIVVIAVILASSLFFGGEAPAREEAKRKEKETVRIEGRNIRDIYIFDLTGKMLDQKGGLLLKKQIEQAGEKGFRKFILNFKNLEGVDEYGIGELLRSYKGIQEEKGEMVIANLSKELKALFKAIKLDMLFGASDSIDEAEAVLKKRCQHANATNR